MFRQLKYFFGHPFQLPIVLLTKFNPKFRFLYETYDYQGKVNFQFWFIHKVLNIGGNKQAYWPVHWTSKVYDVENILIGIDSYPGINGGAYITGRGGLTIGNYTRIAKNVVIVTANHDVYDTRIYHLAPVNIGNYCWLGAGAKIMPGVFLGDFTIIAAGAVVTKSFPEGHCIIAGVPARKIKTLDIEKCVPYENEHKYYGYIPANKFEEFKKKNLRLPS